MKKAVFLLVSTMLLLAICWSCSKTEHESFATLYGVVSDAETGDPINNANIVLSPGGKTMTTGSDGRFEFKDLDPQQYTFTVQKTDYATNRKSVTAVVDAKIEVNIPLTKNK